MYDDDDERYKPKRTIPYGKIFFGVVILGAVVIPRFLPEPEHSYRTRLQEAKTPDRAVSQSFQAIEDEQEAINAAQASANERDREAVRQKLRYDEEHKPWKSRVPVFVIAELSSMLGKYQAASHDIRKEFGSIAGPGISVP